MAAPLTQSPLNPRLKRFLVCAILLLTAGYTFLDYWEYSRIQHADPKSWAQLAAGKGLAPAQYRIGVYYTANFLAHLSHLQFRHIFALSDFVCTALALSSLFYLLTRLAWFRNAALPAQWAQLFLALLLAQIYLVWTLWFQQPETMPSFAILAVAAFLCWAITLPKPPVTRSMLAISLLLLTALGATIRADTVIALASGIVLASIDSRSKTPARISLLVTGIIALLTIFAIEYFITHWLFPHAVRSAPPFQLFGNLQSVNGFMAIFCTLIPWGLTLWLTSRNWPALPLWIKALVIGSALHFVMFLTFGMSEEVRIFLPYSLVLIPLSATLLYAWLSGETVSAL